MGKLEVNKIYEIDSINGVSQLPEIDLTITSPPYNLGIDYGVYKDNLPLSNYITFIKTVFRGVYKATKEGGRICVNVPPDIGVLKERSKISLDTLYDNILTECGFKYRAKIVWHKNQITSRTAWGSFKSPSNPNILPPFEYVLVFYKESPKKIGEKDNIDIEKEEFIEWTNGLWTIAPESKKKTNHPAPYPEELCKRLIKMFSYVGDTVFDPFSGSGTTCVTAKKLNRNYLGFELNIEYVDLANERLGLANFC
ncbi:site-specific DNA-methyltransferase [Bacillus cabrialesii subsp. cabrialesii]|uniref:DNA-methyltransferase n=1 Tax=Bacillus cabrialesii TaxID=2487276 RepID=UPI003305FF16